MNLGDGVSELALQFGADDIDGTVQKESIMHLAGSTTPLDHDKAQLAKIVTNSGSIQFKEIRLTPPLWSSFHQQFLKEGVFAWPRVIE